MVNDHVERVRSAMLTLREPLHDVFAWAEQFRRERLPELTESPDYRWHATHTVRALAHYRLNQLNGELGDWSLSGNHSQNGALWLTDGSYRVRSSMPSTRRTCRHQGPIVCDAPSIGIRAW